MTVWNYYGSHCATDWLSPVNTGNIDGSLHIEHINEAFQLPAYKEHPFVYFTNTEQTRAEKIFLLF